MKKLIFTLSILIILNNVVLASLRVPDVSKDTIINNVQIKVYTGSKGGKYILVVSKKTGKEYKKYLKS